MCAFQLFLSATSENCDSCVTFCFFVPMNGNRNHPGCPQLLPLLGDVKHFNIQLARFRRGNTPNLSTEEQPSAVSTHGELQTAATCVPFPPDLRTDANWLSMSWSSAKCQRPKDTRRAAIVPPPFFCERWKVLIPRMEAYDCPPPGITHQRRNEEAAAHFPSLCVVRTLSLIHI